MRSITLVVVAATNLLLSLKISNDAQSREEPSNKSVLPTQKEDTDRAYLVWREILSDADYKAAHESGDLGQPKRGCHWRDGGR